MTNEELIEELLIEAEALGLREKVLQRSVSIRQFNPKISPFKSYEDAYHQVIEETRTSNRISMTQKQAMLELIEILEGQVIELTMLSKIELGNDVIDEIRKLKMIISKSELENDIIKSKEDE